MHHDAAEIAADHELSERLGAEILAAGCEALPHVHVVRKQYLSTQVRLVDLVSGNVRYETRTEEV